MIRTWKRTLASKRIIIKIFVIKYIVCTVCIARSRSASAALYREPGAALEHSGRPVAARVGAGRLCDRESVQ